MHGYLICIWNSRWIPGSVTFKYVTQTQVASATPDVQHEFNVLRTGQRCLTDKSDAGKFVLENGKTYMSWDSLNPEAPRNLNIQAPVHLAMMRIV